MALKNTTADSSYSSSSSSSVSCSYATASSWDELLPFTSFTARDAFPRLVIQLSIYSSENKTFCSSSSSSSSSVTVSTQPLHHGINSSLLLHRQLEMPFRILVIQLSICSSENKSCHSSSSSSVSVSSSSSFYSSSSFSCFYVG